MPKKYSAKAWPKEEYRGSHTFDCREIPGRWEGETINHPSRTVGQGEEEVNLITPKTRKRRKPKLSLKRWFSFEGFWKKTAVMTCARYVARSWSCWEGRVRYGGCWEPLHSCSLPWHRGWSGGKRPGQLMKSYGGGGNTGCSDFPADSVMRGDRMRTGLYFSRWEVMEAWDLLWKQGQLIPGEC